MNLPTVLDRSRIEIKLGSYGTASATALSDASLLPRVQEYRRQTGSRTMPLDRDDIQTKIPAETYHVSRKVDGEFTVLIFRDGQIFTMNPGGTIRIGLPWFDEAAKLLSKAGVREAMIAGELYAVRDDRRGRVHDVTTIARQPQSNEDLVRLRFAVFDLLSIDGGNPAPTFADNWKTIQRIFGKGEKVHPVEAKQVTDSAGIEKLFAQWVDAEGAEGLVVRSDTAGMFKIKPRHSLDAVVIGFTESVQERQGMLHDMLLAVMRQDGTLHVLTRVGGGLSEDERRSMLSDLKDMVVESEYAEVNSDHVAYQMVQPDWVVEISCLDLISETTRGGPVNRMVLDYRSNGTNQYHVVRRLPLAAVISPQFIRRREDKKTRQADIRLEQVSEIVEVSLADRDARQMTLPKSELLRREVYTKQLKGETMIRKFVLWKTNKEQQGDEYPAFVLHYTDFSPNRQTPLAREVRVSSSLEQMNSLWDELKTENIKKGWDLHSRDERSNRVAAAAESSETVLPSVERPGPVDRQSEAVSVGADVAEVVTADAGNGSGRKKKGAAKMAESETTRKKTTKKKSG